MLFVKNFKDKDKGNNTKEFTVLRNLL
jgi:hypothetical protein